MTDSTQAPNAGKPVLLKGRLGFPLNSYIKSSGLWFKVSSAEVATVVLRQVLSPKE